MKAFLKTIVLGVALACAAVPFLRPETAKAQTTAQSVQGTWVTYGGGGFSKTLLTFNANGTWSLNYADRAGKTINESGTYVVIAQTVATTSRAGFREKMFFFWINANMATIRVVPDGSNRFTEATWTRIR